jgi:heme-degrading monooxygenase HmoA
VEIAATPEPPYYAAVITLRLTPEDVDGYFEMADVMYNAASVQDGFLGVEFVYNTEQRMGITSSYWRDAEAISRWKQEAEHLTAQRLGQERWYSAYHIRICRVERDYGWARP